MKPDELIANATPSIAASWVVSMPPSLVPQTPIWFGWMSPETSRNFTAATVWLRIEGSPQKNVPVEAPVARLWLKIKTAKPNELKERGTEIPKENLAAVRPCNKIIAGCGPRVVGSRMCRQASRLHY